MITQLQGCGQNEGANQFRTLCEVILDQ